MRVPLCRHPVGGTKRCGGSQYGGILHLASGRHRTRCCLLWFQRSPLIDYNAATSQTFAEIGYTYEFDRVRLQPFAGAALIHQWSDGFTETGGAAALSAREETKLLGMTSLGVRSDVLIARFEGVEAALNASATWQHAVGDVDSSTSMRFASGGEAFSVAGSPIDRDAAFVEAGLSLSRGSDLSFGISYQGTFSENAREQGFKAGFKYQF